MSASAPGLSLRLLGQRMRFYMTAKMVGTTVGLTAFFTAYFILVRHPLFQPVMVASTWLDHTVAFAPWTLIPYLTLWAYVALLPALVVDRRELIGCALGYVALGIIGLLVFLVYPTTTPDAGIDWSHYPAFRFLKEADASGNACPSLHAAFAVFTCLWFARLLPRLGAGLFAQGVNFTWAGLIVYSTLGTRQHVALDALFGSLLGAWAAGLNFIATPTAENDCVRRRSLFLTVGVIKLCALLLWMSGIPLGICVGIFVSGGALVLYQIFIPHAGELVSVRTGFSTEKREVWLTLDDGPDPEDTPRILELLDHHHARATFFMIGKNAAQHPALVAEIRRRGHEIGHHTHTHPSGTFWFAGPRRLKRELDSALAVFAATGSAPSRFRAPVGIKNICLGPALAERGLSCIGWSIRSADSFAHEPAAVVTRVERQLRPGAIILMHEGPPVRAAVRVAAIAGVLELLTANGYRAVIPAESVLR